jgi:hypothetical protein
MIDSALYDGRRDSHVHTWFGLTYSSYLVIPRSLLQAMPPEWQANFVRLLREMRVAVEFMQPIDDNYTVSLRDVRGRFVKDPLAEYRHSQVPALTVHRSHVEDSK